MSGNFSTAIAALKEREPGSFLIRDSNSFQGAYGLALKVATPPPNANSHSNKGTLHICFPNFHTPEMQAYYFKPAITDTDAQMNGTMRCLCFLIRKCAQPMHFICNIVVHNISLSLSLKVADPLEQLVRHFLIETGPRGVKIKGCQNEPYFGRENISFDG